ncbi:MAG TPA: glycosyltransferase 87 family protein [Thermoanaerobaculia bacterium]|jgi:hypothetical protein
MKRVLLTIVAASAALYALSVVWAKNRQAAGLDFYIYFVNAQLAARTDVENIYASDTQDRIGEEYYARAAAGRSELRKYDAQRRRRLDNVSSPFLYTAFRWVSRDYDRALLQDHVLLLAAFIIGVLLIARRAAVPLWCALLLLAALLLWYRGFEADLRVGNVNSLQLLGLGAALSAPPLVAGAILGLLFAFKPNVLFVVLLFIVARIAQRDWRRLRLELGGGAIGVAIAIVAAAINYRSLHVWTQWVARANEFYHRIPTRAERNVTPLLALYHQHGATVSHLVALALFAVAAIALLRARRADDALVAGTGMLIYLLSATVVWLHYLVLVVPLALALLRRRATAAIALLALVALAEVPYEWLTHKPAFDVEGTLVGVSLFALFASAVYAMSDRRPRAAV